MRSAALVSLLVVLPATALARAGGGSHYSSGSSYHSSSSSSYHSSSSSSYHSSSSSSYHPSSSSSYHPSSSSSYEPPSSSDSSSSASYYPSPSYDGPVASRRSYSTGSGPWDVGSRFAFAIIAMVLLVLVAMLVIAWLGQADVGGHHRVGDYLDASVQPGRSEADVLREVTLRDPEFDLEAFRTRARTVFLAVQAAWSGRQLASARGLMSDGVLRRFLAQQALMAKEGVRNVTADVRVLGVRLADFDATLGFETLDVEIEASARDADVPVELGDAEALARVKRSGSERFGETWTFARRAGTRTSTHGSVEQGRCPNCGAEYPGGPTAQCAYCRAVINSGHFDWVLSSITQAGEHRTGRVVTGLAEAQQRDPDLHPIVLEDRAQCIFWRVLQARGTVAPELLESVCTTLARDEISGEIRARADQGKRGSFHEAAVGGVELLDLDAGEKFDRAHLLIRWSARATRVDLDGRGEASAPITAHATVFTLQRAHDRVTPPARGLATERCGTCGAAQTVDAPVRCSYCQEPLGASASDWVLLARQNYEAWTADRRAGGQAAQLVANFVHPMERLRLLQTLAALARADGVVTEGERALLHEISRRWRVEVGKVDALLDEPESGELEPPRVASAAAHAFVRLLAEASMADGSIDPPEERLVRTAARELRIDQGEVGELLQTVRATARRRAA